ncbi:hypothetical protein NQ176_g1454 [Zarea fungicola]|uniref:Uncharacterized protein n=1 Tax=Zarea fungicola TaxID=93591 RepID=A0ACC1NT80_9HYPO|nr:hypothetical protein NQ176_g1454 [Lecanicillium fungicola]
MHYIRLLRPPKVVRLTGLHLELLFTITTDLGDSFLYPDAPADVQITAFIPDSPVPTKLKLIKKGQVVWQSGMRVAKPKIAIPRQLHAALLSGINVEICISASQEISADGAQAILLSCHQNGGQGQIMPVWAALSISKELDTSTRKIVLDDSNKRKYFVEVEEDIGESIARHIWDAGVLAMCSIAGAYLCPDLECSQQKLPTAMKNILSCRESLNVLELGCGAGILGIGLATKSERGQTCKELPGIPVSTGLSLRYENLDWEDGRKGRFGTEVASRIWDLIIISDCTYNVDMLPALVETLGAIHGAGASKQAATGPGTRVFLATKPRHASERAFFDLMEQGSWAIQESQVLPLPVLGNEDESVELYLFGRK